MATPLQPYLHLTPPNPIPSSTALANIQSYLSLSQTSPHLHPDCIFSERVGPTFAGNASTGGLVLQQLRRVEAGLRGEWMGVVPGLSFGKGRVSEVEKTMGAFGGGNGDGERVKRRKLARPADAEDVDVHGDGDGKLPDGDDEILDSSISQTQRKHKFAAEEEYYHDDHAIEHIGDEQGPGDDVANYQEQLREAGARTVIGEIGARSNVVRNVKRVPTILATGGYGAATGAGGMGGSGRGTGPMSKEDRKKAKQERHKAQKKEKERARLAAKAVDDVQDLGANQEAGATATENANLVLGTGSGDGAVAGAEPKQNHKAKRKMDRKASKAADKPGMTMAESDSLTTTTGTNFDVPMVDAPPGDGPVPSGAADKNADDKVRRKAEKQARKLAKAERHKQAA